LSPGVISRAWIRRSRDHEISRQRTMGKALTNNL
jgi:hypothetical protein